jgi:hypothetical protein
MSVQLRDCAFRISHGPGDDRLHEFYIPALQASVRYDRMTGYFTSSALAVAAAGVAHLIANGGQMRLLVRARLAAEDVEAIRASHDLRAVLSAASPHGQWSDAAIQTAQQDLQAAADAEWKAIESARWRLAEAQRSAQVARAARLLLDAALVELALGQQPGLLDQADYPAAFNEAAVIGLRRHGYPWAPLLRIAQDNLRAPHPTDPYSVAIQNEPVERLKRRFETLKQRAERLVQDLQPARRPS